MTGATGSGGGGTATGTTSAPTKPAVEAASSQAAQPPPSPAARALAKPKVPDPPPATAGLRVLLDFQRAQVSTTATGTADAAVRPFAKGGGMSTDGSAPGVTPGAPTPAQMKLPPESWRNQAFLDGGPFLQGVHAVAPGEITTTATCELQIVERSDLIAGVDVADSAEPRTARRDGSP